MQALEDTGLSNAEARIYIALLELGPSTTGKIIKKTKLQSSTVYHIIGSLVEKGLITYIFKGKIKYFQAEKPETFLDILEEKRKNIAKLIPELKEREKIGQKHQSAKVYEGMRAVKKAFEEVLNTMKKGEEYYVFTLGEELATKDLKTFLLNFHRKRIEKGVKLKLITPLRAKGIVQEQFEACKLNVRYTKQNLPIGIFIYKGNIMTITWGEIPAAFLIQSEKTYTHYKNFFLEMWKQAKP